jgi:hypothetical protein
MSDAALERRYRRLLAWFPAEHRHTYGEEMIGVLLASAPDGQGRPAPGDVADLVSSGLRTRLRNWSGVRKIDPKWADALAAFTVAAPILMLAYLSYQIRVELHISRFARFIQLRDPNLPSQGQIQLGMWLLEAAVIAAIVALSCCPALIRRQRRTAVAVIAILTVLLGAAATGYVDAIAREPDLQVGFTGFVLLEIAAVVIVPDPGRGWRVLTTRGLLIMIAVAALTLATEWILQSGSANSLTIDRTALELAVAAVGVALILIFGSEAHRRLLVLLAIPGYPILVYVQLYSVMFVNDPHAVGQVLYAPTAIIAALVSLAIWQSSRKQASSILTTGA